MPSIIGEAKWGEIMETSHLERLRRIRGLLAAQGRFGAERAKMVCFGAAGFSDALIRTAEQNSDVVLIDIETLYRGDGSVR